MGRRHLPLRRPRAHRRLATVLAVMGLVALPTMAAAHPLGNFTINHYAGVRIETDRILLDVVIDQAEIPTFQARRSFDTDGDGSVSDAEIDAGRVVACTDIAEQLSVSVDGGAPLSLTVVEAGLAFPAGVGGLPTMRETCALEAALTDAIGTVPVRVDVRDGSYPERIGWREIVAIGSGVTLTATGEGAGPLRTSSVSDRLQSYPPSMIARPLDDRALAVDAVAGGPILPAIAVPDADPIPGVTRQPSVAAASAAASAVASPRTAGPVAGALPGGVGGAEVPSIFREANLTPIVMLLALVTAAGLGAGHALTPGHGKTLMAAYLVGTRGSALHALGLGLAVSISHTAGILVLAAVIVGAAGVLAPDVVVRAAPVAAAISILLIGGWMLVGEVRRRRAASRDPRDGRRHGHAHVDAGDHGHDHDASHAHADAHGHGHAHAPHAPQPGSTISWRSLFLLGLAGGLIPSTSALLILLGSIAAGRPAFGFVLVVAFGLGMAAVMTGIGLVLVAARHRVERASIGVRLVAARELVPLVASVVVLGFGVYLTAQALIGSPAL